MAFLLEMHHDIKALLLAEHFGGRQSAVPLELPTPVQAVSIVNRVFERLTGIFAFDVRK